MDIDEIFDRLCGLTNAKNDAALAKELGVTPQAIANSRKRGTIPFEKICVYAEDKGFSLDYVLLGKADKNTNGEIDDDLKEEVIQALRTRLKAYFRSPQSAPAIDAFSSVYNQVCHLPNGPGRSESIRKSIGWLIVSINQTVIDTIENSPDENFSQDVRDTTKKGLQSGIASIKDKYGLSDSEVDRSVNQNFNAEVGQVGGGDIHNYSKKDK
ncbi:helix-turn-helix domain-containing protein [Nitrincola sp.]|uniref:helix-turn-helix domain-containing protein n=1 Tax=Nitrincola sp. TaxID=1926584 RepID=UPI003A8F4FC7